VVDHGPGFAFHLFWILPIFAILVIGLVALIVWAVRASERHAYLVGPPSAQMGGTPPVASARETPLEILARRFASGEITADEYTKARDLLHGGS
jgi:putative membrane protein